MQRKASAIVLAVVGLVGLFAGALHAPSASAQGDITVISEEPRNEFPRGVTFSITFNAAEPPDEVRLRYELAPDGTGASGIAECTEAAATTCSFTLTSGASINVIPGAEITYHWQITGADGAETETEERLYVHTDTRFDFRTVEQDNVTVYYHPGTEAQAPIVLEAAAAALRDVGALEQTQVRFPIKIFVYETAEEMSPSIAGGGSIGGAILGEVVYSDTAMVAVDIAPTDIVRHEVAHIVTREATRGPFGIALWMNEGISVYAQNRVLAGHQQALDSAISVDRVLTMPQLNSAASRGTEDTVSLFYGQSGSIVRFMVETYGAEEFAQLLRTFKDGATPDDAYEQVYGLDELGLENAWRESVGLAPRTASATPAPAPTEQIRGDDPTSKPDGESIPSTGKNGDDTPIVTIAVIVALAALAIAALVAFVNVVRQRA